MFKKKPDDESIIYTILPAKFRIKETLMNGFGISERQGNFKVAKKIINKQLAHYYGK